MRLRYFESSPSIAVGPTPLASMNSNTQKERTMRCLSISFALSTLLLATICSAQQTAQNTPSDPAQQNLPPALGDSNSFLGQGAGVANTFGTGNSFIGNAAGSANTTGNYNTYLGDRSGLHQTGSWDTYIGTNAGVAAPTENNTMRLGAPQGNTTATFIEGVWEASVMGTTPVLIDSTGHIGTMTTSSLRFKEQVHDMGDSTSRLMELRPVTFLYKPEYANGDHTLQYGLIAEEVAKVYPELVAYDKVGQPYAVHYQYLSTMLLNEVQKQNHRAEAQAELIKAQQQEIADLNQQLHVQNAALQERVSRLEALARAERAAAH
jgi:trimeric autotransporter adhesin